MALLSCSWSTSVSSASARPLRSSRSSWILALPSYGYHPSIAPAQPAVSTLPCPALPFITPPIPAHLRAASCLCPAANHKVFNPLRSSTFLVSGRPVNVAYGSGEMSGFLAYDTVKVTREPGATTGLVLGVNTGSVIWECLSAPAGSLWGSPPQ